ncbi:baculoviral IAP repeat-containing protein 5b isoform X2 [Austrofundulus limnaeus]|uniref:Baculoviral IAP repeat-containing protein 5b isoform X2 n=1 Tax=Austrofundulus limnaeus TaxID=52670 RepID=A0A2I4BU07_AUSLI|nr:PREDICTED: baculoviral IAP repeat-containing protein 5.1-A-like isoform X2 [Austrofundulus limnaeus]
MASIDMLNSRFLTYDKMYHHDLREQSFEDWPFKDECNCTPAQMAKAGFVHCPTENEPDVACCFFCLIELEGWEPDDDPWSEHAKRSPKCGFLSLKKDFTELTRKVCHKELAYLRELVDKTLEGLKSQLDLL